MLPNGFNYDWKWRYIFLRRLESNISNISISNNINNLHKKIMKTKVNNKPNKPEKFTWAKHNKWLNGFRSETIYPTKLIKRKRGKNVK